MSAHLTWELLKNLSKTEWRKRKANRRSESMTPRFLELEGVSGRYAGYTQIEAHPGRRLVPVQTEAPQTPYAFFEVYELDRSLA
jgi:hypothetical protein